MGWAQFKLPLEAVSCRDSMASQILGWLTAGILQFEVIIDIINKPKHSGLATLDLISSENLLLGLNLIFVYF
jgi:hypothetical protein